MRGGIAERGGIRVGHRIIEINGQSVVATPHEKIIHILTNAVGEVKEGSNPNSWALFAQFPVSLQYVVSVRKGCKHVFKCFL